jgi:hypothetical protein
MYCIEVIKSPSYQAGRKIKDNHNRDSSFVRSRGSYVIHSGIHRETAFLIDEGIPAFDYWSKQGQAAINGFIEATIADYALDDCEHNAIAKRHPDWTFNRVNSCGNFIVSAYHGLGFQTRISALSWQELNEKIK